MSVSVSVSVDESLLADTTTTAHRPDRGCRACKQRVKVFYWIGDYSSMIEALKSFFEFVKRHKIHKNESEKCINSIIECVTSSADAETHDDMLLEFYQCLIAGVEDIGGNDVR